MKTHLASTSVAPFRTITIGEQTWSAQNISYPLEGSVFYDHNPDNGKIFGPLYTHAQAVEVSKKFPGWRLPDRTDVDLLISFLGGSHHAGRAMKVTSSSGFDALFAGFRDATSGKFYRIHKQTGFWTSTLDDHDTAWKFYLTIERDNLNFHPVSRNYGDSIRLIKIK